MLALSVSFAIWLMPNNSEVKASDTSFGIVSTSIRNNEDKVYGLQFTTNVSADWFTEHASDKYSFGTLVAPADRLNETFDPNASANANMNAMEDADNIIVKPDKISASGFEYSASIVFDRAVVENHIQEKGWTATVDEVLNKLYKYDFVAIPYASYKSGEYTKFVYAEPYVANMYETAVLTYAKGVTDKNEEWKSIAEIYLGDLKDVDKTAVLSAKENLLVVEDDEFVFEETDVIIANGKILAYNNGFTVDEKGFATIDGEFTSNKTKTQKILIISGSDAIILDTFVADNVITTAEELTYLFSNNIWVEGETIFAEINVLGSDIDMAGITLTQTTRTSYTGHFDGRGHVISNLTKDMGITNQSSASAGLFGTLPQKNAPTIKNFALDNLTVLRGNINDGLLAYQTRGTFQNIYIKYSPGSNIHQLFCYTIGGSLKNMIIERPYDENFDIDAYMKDDANDNVAVISRFYEKNNTSTMTNVQVISQTPLFMPSNYGSDVSYTQNAETGVYNVSTWGAYYSYGENETKLWYDFAYFHRAVDDPEKPGLGIPAGQATVQNTQVLVDGVPTTDKTVGKTRVYKGVRRYDTNNAMLTDTENQANVQTLINTGMWKLDEGRLVWKNSKNLSKYNEYIEDADYDASQNALISTALNGVIVRKVTVNGVELSLENKEYTVDENGYLTSIYAKKSATDTKNGISYKVNSADNTIQDDVVIESKYVKYHLTGTNYWTRIIDTAEELKLALDIDYTKDQGGNSENGIVYNKHTDDVEYVFNAGIYKLGANINMYDAENETYVQFNYTGIPVSYSTSTYGALRISSITSISGGFSGTFDGDGYVIDNFKPTKHGLFGVFATTGSGLDTGANVKNVAFTNVINVSKTGTTVKPILAAYVYNGEECAQNVSNVYVTYSDNSTDMHGLVASPTVNLYLKDIYVVNEQGYNMISNDRKAQYYGVTLENDVSYRNIFHQGNNEWSYTSALFPCFYSMNNIGTTYINNVYVASPNSVGYNYCFEFPSLEAFLIDYSTRTITFTSDYALRVTCSVSATAYMCKNCGYYFESQACTTDGCGGTEFTKISKVSKSKARMFAYAGNETYSNIPQIKNFAPQVKTDVYTDPYRDESGDLVVPFSLLRAVDNSTSTKKPDGYICDTCKITASLFKGTACYREDCEGVCNVESLESNGENYYYCGFYSSALAWQWTLPKVSSRTSSTLISNTNNTLRFMGVTRYDSVEKLEQNVDFKASNFATNKYWKVTDDGKLYWASLYTA